jgi:hypothetical protein
MMQKTSNVYHGGSMLETPEERIKLLKAGFTGKTIEMLYIKSNNLKKISILAVIELVEIDVQAEKKICNTSMVTAEYKVQNREFRRKELVNVS